MLKMMSGFLKKRQERLDRQVKKAIQRWSVSCKRCVKISVPDFGTHDRYQCLGCGCQFAGTPHHIKSQLHEGSGEPMSRRYEKAVSAMKKQVIY